MNAFGYMKANWYEKIPYAQKDELISRIKIMSELDIAKSADLRMVRFHIMLWAKILISEYRFYLLNLVRKQCCGFWIGSRSNGKCTFESPCCIARRCDKRYMF